MSAAGGAACAEFLPDRSIRITFTYRAEVVEQLKDLVPSLGRTFDKASRSWTISPGWAWTTITMLRWNYEHVEVIDPLQQENKAKGHNPDQAFATLYLIETAPAPVVDAAYKALARIHHPDCGGSTTAMQQINAAYETIQRRIG